MSVCVSLIKTDLLFKHPEGKKAASHAGGRQVGSFGPGEEEQGLAGERARSGDLKGG